VTQELHAGATNLAYKAMLELRPDIGRLHCDAFHLDSGLGPDRTDAHRLYFNKRMRISSFHFQRPV
jgi:hypothetical protein